MRLAIRRALTDPALPDAALAEIEAAGSAWSTGPSLPIGFFVIAAASPTME
jgi:hypothetical protein